MEQNPSQTLLASLENVQVFRLLQNDRLKLCEGLLRVLESQGREQAYYFHVEKFYYTLHKNIPFIIVENETHTTLIFPHVDLGFSALVLPKSSENLDALLSVLGNLVTIQTSEVALQNPELQQRINTHCSSIFTVPLVEDNKALHYIGVTGGILKKGFGWFGGILAKGVNKTGEFINSKIEKGETKEVPVETKEKLGNIKSKTANVFKTTTEVVGTVLKPVVQGTNQLIDSTSKKIDEGDNSALKAVKLYGKAAGNALSEAFQGLSVGAKEVGSALSTNTRQIVQKKWGDDVSATYLGQPEQQQQQAQPQQQGTDIQQQAQQQANNVEAAPQPRNPYPQFNEDQQQHQQEQPQPPQPLNDSLNQSGVGYPAKSGYHEIPSQEGL